MEDYKGSKNSGIRAYEIVDNGLVVWFKEKESPYLYDIERPGETHILEMRNLAKKGKDLATYINKHVRDNYKKILQKPIKRRDN